MGSSQSKQNQSSMPSQAASTDPAATSSSNDRSTTSARRNDDGAAAGGGGSSSSQYNSSNKPPLNHPPIGSGGGECPMKKDGGGYLGGFFGGNKKKQLAEENVTNDGGDSPSDAESNGGGGGCPVKGKGGKVQYNVYSQPIDPSNNMPSVANQLPAPQQSQPLDTNRVKSNIPKGNSDETWTYPSPQMFYNSLARKNKLGDTKESDIESVVAIHNNMNEKTWAKVVEWEEVLNPDSSGGPKLLKFLGRPSDLSPKAKIKSLLFGHPLPFDRHDWTVVRPDGTEVRYVIDYYFDETRASETEESAMPNLHDRDAVKSVLVDVRPAADSASTIFGRTVMMPIARHVNQSTQFEPLPMLPTNDLKKQVGESEKVWDNIQKSVRESRQKAAGVIEEAKSMVLTQDDLPEEQRKKVMDISDDEARDIAKSFATMLDECKKIQKLVDDCKDEAECAKASLALTMCLAKVVCPLQQKAVADVLDAADDLDSDDENTVKAYNAKFEKALENMSLCVTSKSERAAAARQRHPNLFADIEKGAK